MAQSRTRLRRWIRLASGLLSRPGSPWFAYSRDNAHSAGDQENLAPIHSNVTNLPGFPHSALLGPQTLTWHAWDRYHDMPPCTGISKITAVLQNYCCHRAFRNLHLPRTCQENPGTCISTVMTVRNLTHLHTPRFAVGVQNLHIWRSTTTHWRSGLKCVQSRYAVYGPRFRCFAAQGNRNWSTSMAERLKPRWAPAWTTNPPLGPLTS